MLASHLNMKFQAHPRKSLRGVRFRRTTKQSHGITWDCFPLDKLGVAMTLLIGILFLASCSNAVVATVDGYKITAGDLKASIRIEKEKYDPIILKTAENSQALKKAVLESLIQEAVLLNIAKKDDITVSDEELKKELLKARDTVDDTWKEKQRRRIIISKLIKKELADKIPITPEEIQGYYKEHREEFYQPTQYHARQIVVDNKELANQIHSRITKGEDFAKLAEEFSLSPDRKRGGDLGFFNATTFPPIFAEICGKLKPGETSGVVATDYGFQIFNLIEKRQPRQRPLEEAMADIRSLLMEKRLEKAFDGWFRGQRDNAKITIYDKVLEDVNV